MHRKGLSLFLAAAMAIAIAAPGFAAGNPFPDVPTDHWAYDAVTGLAAAGLVEGYPDGTFGGDRTFTRYEMAMVFSRILTRMEALLLNEIDQRIATKSGEMEAQIANAAAKAQEALAAALMANDRVDAIEAEIESLTKKIEDIAAADHGQFIMTEEAKTAIAQYVAELLAKEMATIEDNAARIAALEKKAISADEAEEIATRIVAEKLAGALGRISDLETAVAAVKGDIDSIHAIIQDKVDAITASVEALGTEFAQEIAELRSQIAGMKETLQKLGAQMEDADANLLARIDENHGLILDNDSRTTELEQQVAGIWEATEFLLKGSEAQEEQIKDLQRKAAESTLKDAEFEEQIAALQANVKENAAAIADNQASISKIANDLTALILDNAAAIVDTNLKISNISKELDSRISELEQQVAGVWEATEFMLKDSEAQQEQLNNLLRKAEESILKAAELEEQITAVQADVKDNAAAIADNQASISKTASDLTALAEKQDAENKKLAGILSPIKEKFDATEINMGAHLQVTNVSGNVIFNDPRSSNQSVGQRARAMNWYDESRFLNNEALAVYTIDLATVPAPGANLRSTLYISKDLLLPGAHDAGIDIDLTTNSPLRSLHLGSLQTGITGFDISNFDVRILSSEKWDALLWRPKGMQASITMPKLQADLIFGQADARRIGPDLNPIVSVPNSDTAHYGAVSLTAPITNMFQVRANWLNFAGTSLGALPTPVNAAAQVQSLSVFGNSDVMDYNATIAIKNDSKAKSGDVQISRIFGQTGVNEKGQPLGIKVLAEYGCNEANWLQPLASPQQAATLEGKQEKYLGLEISGLRLLDFHTKLTHRSVSNFGGDRTSLLINATRELKVMLPLLATIEYGLNDDINSTTDYQHFMIELGVKKYHMFADRLVVSASYGQELNPIEAKNWEQRWRNINVVDAFWSPAQLQQAKNWAVDSVDLETMRQASQAQADWVLARSADGRNGLVASVGYRKITDVLNKTKVKVLDEQVISVGLQANVDIRGTALSAAYGLENAKGALSSKQSLNLGFNRAIGGAGFILGEAKGSWGQGAQLADVSDVQAYLKWEQPVYEAAQWQLAAGYSRLLGSAADDFTAFTLNSGLTMRF